MSVCRFCLSNKPRKNITELKVLQSDCWKDYKEIMFFCIGTQVEDDSKVSPKLCLKCFRKTIEFFEFKTLALKNEALLRSIDVANIIKNEVSKDDIKTEIESVDVNSVDSVVGNVVDNGFESDARYDEVEIEFKDEPRSEDGSDDELLSVMQKIKYEFIEEKENAPIKRKRGRPKTRTHIKIKVPKVKRDLPIGPFHCEECGKFVRDLKAHSLIHLPVEERKRFKCEFCEIVFVSAQAKYKHKKRIHFNTKKECPICHKNYKTCKHITRGYHTAATLSEFGESKQASNLGPMKICEECGKHVRDLKAHSLTHVPLEQRKRYTCEICDKAFISTQSRSKHRKRRHFNTKKPCPVCQKMVLHLNMHMKVHNPEELKFECAPCGRRFISQSRLDMHVSVHTKDRPFECDICQTKFRLKVSMLLHKRQVHDKEKSHLCQYCSKSFFKKHHLQIHLRSHTKEKPYKCVTCNKKFSSRTILNNHTLIHSDDKKYACTLCDMSFVRRGYLNAHMLSHTKEKRFPCQYCGVRFHRSDHRKRHEFTAHVKHTTSTTA